MSALLPTFARSDLAFERGEGVTIYTTAGERYLDFGAGVAVSSLGHGHPHLVASLREQAGKLLHTSNIYRIPEQEAVAERLCDNSFADMAFFCNSGAEAVEGAVKVARRYQHYLGRPECYRVMTFEGAFHGRTLAMIAAGKQEKHLAGFGPEVDGFDQVPLGDAEAVKAAIGPETAAILIEPIQGEGGVRHATWPFLRELRSIADENELVLIFDEVQTGMGRTGKLFAYEWAGIEPDIMALAKGLGGGFPMGAVLTTEHVGIAMTAGSHGTTFGGNPMAMAAATAVLDITLANGFLDEVGRKALLLKQKLAEIADTNRDFISEIRGEGLLVGLQSKIPNTQLADAFQQQRLLTIVAGDNVVRLLPPLIASEADINEACEKINSACASLRASPQTEGSA